MGRIVSFVTFEYFDSIHQLLHRLSSSATGSECVLFMLRHQQGRWFLGDQVEDSEKVLVGLIICGLTLVEILWR